MPEIKYVARLIESVEDKKDLWLIYELCDGKNMNESLFDVRGEFFKGERIYMVNHSEFYHCLRGNIELMRDFVCKVASALKVFSTFNIVHADLKPDNILVSFNEST